MSDEVILKGLVARTLPAAQSDGDESNIAARVSRYGDQLAIQVGGPRQGLVDEGSYFIATNPTPGTGIAPNAVETSFSDTRGFFVIKNTEDPGNPQAKRIYMDYLKLILLATAPTATVSQHFALKRSKISREPTTAANRTLLSPVQMASASGRASIARPMSYANAGAMTVPASAAEDPVVGRVCLPTSLGIAGDEYLLKFGSDDLGAVAGLTAVRATAPARIVGLLPPVVIEAGESLVIHRWWLTEATNAPNFEFELAWYER